jgi:hypothetical protein
MVGIHPDTLAAHCESEHWINPVDIIRQNSAERIRNFVDEFIEQDREAIKRNLAAKHSLNERILALAARHIDRLEKDELFAIEKGTDRNGAPILVMEDPVVSLRRLSLVAQSVEAMDKSIADLKDGSWRVKEEKPPEGADAALNPKQIEALLQSLDKPGDEAEMN